MRKTKYVAGYGYMTSKNFSFPRENLLKNENELHKEIILNEKNKNSQNLSERRKNMKKLKLIGKGVNFL